MMSLGGSNAQQSAIECWRIPVPPPVATTATPSHEEDEEEDEEEEEEEMEMADYGEEEECMDEEEDEGGYNSMSNSFGMNLGGGVAGGASSSHRRKKARPTRLPEQPQGSTAPVPADPQPQQEPESSFREMPSLPEADEGNASPEGLTCGLCAAVFPSEAALEGHDCRGSATSLPSSTQETPLVCAASLAPPLPPPPLEMRPSALLEGLFGAARSVGSALPVFPNPADVAQTPLSLLNNNNNNNNNNNTACANAAKISAPSSLPAPKDDDYCEICEKHFCNKYYLRKHKADVHGIQSEPFSAQTGGSGRRKPGTGGATSGSCGAQALLFGGEGATDLASVSSHQGSPGGVPGGVNASAAAAAGGSANQQCPPPLNPLAFMAPPPVNTLAFFQQMSSAAQMLQQFATHSFIQPPGLSPFVLPPPRPPVSAADFSGPCGGPVSSAMAPRPPLAGGLRLGLDLAPKEAPPGSPGSGGNGASPGVLKAHLAASHGGAFGPAASEEKRAPSSSPPGMPPTSMPCLEVPLSLPMPLGGANLALDLGKLAACGGEAPSAAATDLYCPLCKLEFPNKFALKAHCASLHGASPLSASSPIPPLPSTPVHMAAAAAALASLNSPPPPGQMPQGPGGAGGLDAFHTSMLAAKLADRVTCDICKKDVCNKYFLKTHKMKVHGIVPSSSSSSSLSGGTNTATTVTAAPSAGATFGMAAPTGDETLRSMTPQGAQNGQCPAGSPPSIKLDNKSPGPKTGLTLLPPLGPHTPEKLSCLASSSAPSSAPLNASELIKMGIDPEAYCEICKKELCSKYFLKTHKHNIHGITVSPMSASPTAPSQPPPLSSNAPVSSVCAPNCSAAGGVTSLNLSGIGGATLTASVAANDAARRVAVTSVTAPMGQPLGASAGVMVTSAVGATPPGTTAAQAPSSASSTSSTSSSTQQRVKCDICHKELCNKYFLRTHKLKRHKIAADGSQTPQGSPMVPPTCKIPRLNGSLEVPSPLLPALSSLDARRSWLDSAFDSVLHHGPSGMQFASLPPPPPLHMGANSGANGGSLGVPNTPGGGAGGAKLQPMMPICHLCGLLCPDESKRRCHMQQVHGGDLNPLVKLEPAAFAAAAAAAAASGALMRSPSGVLEPSNQDLPLNLSVKNEPYSRPEAPLGATTAASTAASLPQDLSLGPTGRSLLSLYLPMTSAPPQKALAGHAATPLPSWRQRLARSHRRRHYRRHRSLLPPLCRFQCRLCRAQFTFAATCRRHLAERHPSVAPNSKRAMCRLRSLPTAAARPAALPPVQSTSSSSPPPPPQQPPQQPPAPPQVSVPASPPVSRPPLFLANVADVAARAAAAARAADSLRSHLMLGAAAAAANLAKSGPQSSAAGPTANLNGFSAP